MLDKLSLPIKQSNKVKIISSPIIGKILKKQKGYAFFSKIDISIQYYVLKNLNIKVCEAVIAHLNTDFILNDQKIDYKNLKIEVDVLETIEHKTQLVAEWIKDLLPITMENAEEPDVGIGDHCKDCQYLERCKSKTHLANVDTPI